MGQHQPLFGQALTRNEICRLPTVIAELTPGVRLVDELANTGRMDIRWGGSNVKYVELRDRVTGYRTSGRSFVSWNFALEQAAHKMRSLIHVPADE